MVFSGLSPLQIIGCAEHTAPLNARVPACWLQQPAHRMAACYFWEAMLYGQCYAVTVELQPLALSSCSGMSPGLSAYAVFKAILLLVTCVNSS